MDAFVAEHGLGQALVAPIPVRIWPGKLREPDIFFIFKEHIDRIGEQVCGVPDLVGKVISAGMQKTDRVEKFVEYAKAGVPEYWMVELEERAIEVYMLREGAYILLGQYGYCQAAGSSILPGFTLSVDEVFL